jgi:hypothetical protein
MHHLRVSNDSIRRFDNRAQCRFHWQILLLCRWGAQTTRSQSHRYNRSRIGFDDLVSDNATLGVNCEAFLLYALMPLYIPRSFLRLWLDSIAGRRNERSHYQATAATADDTCSGHLAEGIVWRWLPWFLDDCRFRLPRTLHGAGFSWVDLRLAHHTVISWHMPKY